MSYRKFESLTMMMDLIFFGKFAKTFWINWFPVKRRYIRGNSAPFMNKTLSKEIMKRNKYFEKRSKEDCQIYAKQRNLYASRIRKTKRSKSLNKKMSQTQLKVLKNRKTDAFKINQLALKNPYWSKIKRFLPVTKRFKVGRSPSEKICFNCYNESPSKIMKNSSYFILKALLKIFKFLFSRLVI